VCVVAAEEDPSHRWQLHQALLRFLADMGLLNTMPKSNDTNDLLAFALQQVRWS
jgi:hypothetical protein